MCWPIFWGFGWIFPLAGLLMCLAFMAVMRFAGGGRGFMCMGGGRTHERTDGIARNQP